MPNVSNLVKKTDYSTKIENKITADHDHDKCIANQEFKKLTSENFTARLAQVNLASKSDITNFVKKTDLNKNELKELSKKVKAIPTKGLTNDLINLVFLMEYSIVFKVIQPLVGHVPAKKYTKYFSGTTLIDLWKSDGM